MPKISQITLQKRYGGKWIALSKGGGKVYACSVTVKGLYQELKEKKIDPVKKTILSKVEKPGKASVY